MTRPTSDVEICLEKTDEMSALSERPLLSSEALYPSLSGVGLPYE